VDELGTSWGQGAGGSEPKGISQAAALLGRIASGLGSPAQGGREGGSDEREICPHPAAEKPRYQPIEEPPGKADLLQSAAAKNQPSAVPEPMTSRLPFPAFALLASEIERNVTAALAEDVGAGDLTAELIPAERTGQAGVIAREAAVICGVDWFTAAFAALSPDIRIDWQVRDGDRVEPNDTLCTLTGPARALLTGERTALNFLQLLSGVATKTRRFVQAVAGTRAHIVDTRKTLPGLRLAQKYAVWCGGGGNHRLGLHDAILIKENHILAAGGIPEVLKDAISIAEASCGRCQFIQIEVENLAELDSALAAGAKMLLLDNFSLADLRAAVAKTDHRAMLEASGGVGIESVRAIAEAGVDRISIGGLTKDVQALDLSMRFTNA
jgi:nicotinate-nucleotide pyrophosphorylase (carboxylating)